MRLAVSLKNYNTIPYQNFDQRLHELVQWVSTSLQETQAPYCLSAGICSMCWQSIQKDFIFHLLSKVTTALPLKDSTRSSPGLPFERPEAFMIRLICGNFRYLILFDDSKNRI